MTVGNIGLATYGTAFILGRSTSSWVQDFSFELRKAKELDGLTIESFLGKFREYFGAKVEEHRAKTKGEAEVGFLIAGYDDKGVGRIYRVVFPGAEPTEKASTKASGMTWQGDTNTIQRIILGADLIQLSQLDFFQKLDDQAKKAARDQLGQMQYQIFYNFLSLQDAIELATFLVEATVVMQRFSFGTVGKIGDVPSVGGPVDSLVITPGGLSWIRQKQLTSP